MKERKETSRRTLVLLPFLFARASLALASVIVVAAAKPRADTAPPDLAFCFYADWWRADSFSAEAAT